MALSTYPPRFRVTGVLAASLVVLLLPERARAETHHVPADFATIQAALDAAGTNDTVLVAPGTYSGDGNRELLFDGKSLVLRSSGGAASTVLDCEGAGRALTFLSGETQTAVVEGFTLRNGSASFGGAITCEQSSPTIRDCVIVGNRAAYAGGVHCLRSSAVFERCVISGNEATDFDGGGIYCEYSSPRIQACLVTGNLGAYGGGIRCHRSSSPTLESCTVSGNQADNGGALYASHDSSPQIQSSIFWGNCAQQEGAEVFATSGTTVQFSCALLDSAGIAGPGEVQLAATVIFANPLFCGPEPCSSAPTAEGTYTLAENSPALGETHPCEILIGPLGAECELVGITQHSWGTIKQWFRGSEGAAAERESEP